jgi:flagellar protein FlbD
MIHVTRFNGAMFYINAEMILTVEGTPDTVITLTNNIKILVKERPEIVVEKIINYQRLIRNPQFSLNSGE